MDSDRAEPYGRLAAITFMKRYCEFLGCNISPKSIKTYCDNANVIKHDLEEKNPWYSPSVTMKPNWDVYTQVFQSKKELNKVFQDIKPCIHVKGHLDKKKSIEELPWPIQLNCRCDQLATEILHNYKDKEQDNMFPLPACPAYLLCNGTYITSKSIKYIEDLTNEQQLHAYHKKRHQWDEITFRDIDWDAFRTARRFKTTSKNFTTKLCHKGLPTLKRLHKYKERESPHCIKCNSIEEQAHIFQCTSQSEWKKTFIKNLRRHLKKYDTAPKLKVAILAGCTTWLDAKPNTHYYNPQASIGWEAFHYGYLAAEWQHEQAAHYALKNRTQPKKNQKMTVKRLFTSKSKKTNQKRER
jgi:hypothetical protein